MIHSIENSTYRVSASETGAELCSFIDKRDGHEYIWQGNSVWNGHSPLLFPIVGKLRDDIYTLGGAEYVIPSTALPSGPPLRWNPILPKR